MKIFQKKLQFLLVTVYILSFVVMPVFADTQDNTEVFSYLFHLYYDNGQFFVDRDFQFKYDLVAESYTPEVISETNSYRGEVVSIRNDILAVFNFNLQQGDPDFNEGKVSIKGPYFADAKEVRFYNDARQLLLTVDVSGSSFCDDDNVCDEDVGENPANCPNDCKVAIPAAPTRDFPWNRVVCSESGGPLPTARFTANGSTNIIVDSSTRIDYVWSSINAFSGSTTLQVKDSSGNNVSRDPCSPANITGFFPHISGTEGNLSRTVQSCQRGFTYIITYTAVGNGGLDSSTVTIRVTGVAPPPPVTYGCNFLGQCVEDADGSFTSSNCDDQCRAPGEPLNITISSLLDGVVGQEYSQTITASGGGRAIYFFNCWWWFVFWLDIVQRRDNQWYAYHFRYLHLYCSSYRFK